MLDNNSATAHNAIDDSKPKNTRAMTGFPVSKQKKCDSAMLDNNLGNARHAIRGNPPKYWEQQAQEPSETMTGFPSFPTKERNFYHAGQQL